MPASAAPSPRHSGMSSSAMPEPAARAPMSFIVPGAMVKATATIPAALRPFQHSAFAEERRLHVGNESDHDDGEVARRRHRRRGRAAPDAELCRGGEGVFAHVVAGDGETLGRHVAAHGQSHLAEADQSDMVDCRGDHLSTRYPQIAEAIEPSITPAARRPRDMSAKASVPMNRLMVKPMPPRIATP